MKLLQIFYDLWICLDGNCYDPHDFGVAEDTASKNVFFFQKQQDIQLFISPTISKHRFSFLSSVMPFDDLEKRRQLWGTDRFAAARALTNIFKSLNDARFRLHTKSYRTAGSHGFARFEKNCSFLPNLIF